MARQRTQQPVDFVEAMEDTPTVPLQRYELESEHVVARDNAALARRASHGWRISWLMESTANIPDPRNPISAPLTAIWIILWERPIPLKEPPF